MNKLTVDNKNNSKYTRGRQNINQDAGIKNLKLI